VEVAAPTSSFYVNNSKRAAFHICIDEKSSVR
jgi:hypothetical protein